MPGSWRRRSQRDEPAALAGLGVADDFGHLPDVHLRVGRASARRLCASAAASAAWSTGPLATTAMSIPRGVWRTWYSSAAGVRDHDGADGERVDRGGPVAAECVVGAPLDGGAQLAGAVGWPGGG